MISVPVFRYFEKREREFEEEAFVGSLNEIENKNLLQHSHVKKVRSLFGVNKVSSSSIHLRSHPLHTN